MEKLYTKLGKKQVEKRRQKLRETYLTYKLKVHCMMHNNICKGIISVFLASLTKNLEELLQRGRDVHCAFLEYILLVYLSFLVSVRSGDIETNSGHYLLLQSIQAGFHQGHSIFSATIEIQRRCMSFYQIYSSDFQSEVVGMKLTLGKFHKKMIIFIDSRVVTDLNLFIIARGCHCTKNKIFH